MLQSASGLRAPVVPVGRRSMELPRKFTTSLANADAVKKQETGKADARCRTRQEVRKEGGRFAVGGPEISPRRQEENL